MDNFSIVVGRNIRRLRKARGLKQYQLSMKIEAGHNQIGTWENGRCCPSAYALCRLADVLDCTTDELLGRCKA